MRRPEPLDPGPGAWAALTTSSSVELDGSPAEGAGLDDPTDGADDVVDALGPVDGTAPAAGADAPGAGARPDGRGDVLATVRGAVEEPVVVPGRVVEVPDVGRGAGVVLGRGAAVVGFGAAVVGRGAGAGAGAAGWADGALPEPNRNPTDDPGLGS